MLSFRPMAALLLALLPVVSQAADDVGALRAELQAMKNEYSARVEALEARIQQLEGSQAQVAAVTPPPAPAAAPKSNASAFNPAVSLILAAATSAPRATPKTGAWPALPRMGVRSVPASAASTSANPRSR